MVRDWEVGGSNPLAPTNSFWTNNLQHRKMPTTACLSANKSVIQMRSPKQLHFLLQIGVKWGDAATTFSHFVAHVAQLGPASTWVARNRGRFSQPIPVIGVFESLLLIASAHVVVLMAHPVIDEELPSLEGSTASRKRRNGVHFDLSSFSFAKPEL